MDKLVSIIVPVYNVEKYLIKCVDSIINQTYKNIEILLIDDGSTDSSGKICDEISKKDKRIKVFHKKNGGLSDARNYGILKSKGEYLSFIDSDDYIDDDMIEKMYYGCVDNNCDIACCGKYKEFDNKKTEMINCEKAPFIFSKNEALKSIFIMNKIDTSACDKLYKRNLFNNIKFPTGKYYEDLGTIYKIIDEANCIYHIGEAKYHYFIRNNSITTSNFNPKHLDYVYFAEEICEYFKNNEDIIEYIRSYYYLTLNTILQDFYNKNAIKKYNKLYKNVRFKYKKNIINMIKSNYISTKKKIMLILVYFKFYRTVNMIKKIVK